LASKTGHEAGEHNRDDDIQSEAEVQPSSVLTILWTAIATAEVKGIVHSPSSKPAMSAENQDVLLTAIAKARAWIDDLAAGRAASFAEIASREGKVERHIRFLAPLAFVSPRIISAIAERSAPDLKVTDLAKALTCSWTEQEQWVECRMRRD
jgi:site-specific DNA recombinase